MAVMAGRPGVRSSSRRTTPQSPPQAKAPAASAPERSKRTTRSQSHDVSDKEASVANTRRTVQASSLKGRGGRRIRQVAHAEPIRDLSAVDEIPSDAGSDAEENLELVDVRRSLSAISGTTARTSHSAQELADLSSDEMVDALPDLVDSSDKLLRLVLPSNTSNTTISDLIESLQDHSSRRSKSFIRLANVFGIHKNIYGNETYINLSIALRGLLAVRRSAEVGNGPWRPDDIFFKANLAIMITSLVSVPPQAAQPFIEKLERDFPTPFLSSLTNTMKPIQTLVESALRDETLSTAFLLRVQYFLLLLNQSVHQPNFDPDILLNQVFYASNGQIKGWDIPGLRTEELSKSHIKYITENLASIQSKFDANAADLSTGQIGDLEALYAEYSWTQFVAKITEWTRLRHDEIEAHLSTMGGVSGIKRRLATEIQRRAITNTELRRDSGEGADVPLIRLDYPPLSELSIPKSGQTETDVESLAWRYRKASKVNPGYNRRSGVEFVKQKVAIEKAAQLAKQQEAALQQPSQKGAVLTATGSSARSTNRSSRPTTTQLPATAPAKVTNDLEVQRTTYHDWQPQIEDDEPLLPRLTNISPAERRRRIIQTHKEYVAEQDKENRPQPQITLAGPSKARSFIDRQPNAEKVFFDSQKSTQTALPNSPRSKRDRPPEPEQDDDMPDPSEDESFQQDSRMSLQRSGSQPKSRRLPTAPSRKPAAKRVRVNKAREDNTGFDPDYQAARVEANGEPPLSQMETLKVANTQAKRIAAMHSQKGIQRRTPWSIEETNTFLDLIQENGLSWARLKAIDSAGDNVLWRRDEVALKDKARNMKMDYLKSNIELPFNMDKVPLKMADVVKLEKLGVRMAVDDED